jgi:hypothetical protein
VPTLVTLAVVGILCSAPLPLLAWWWCARRRAPRARTVVALVAAAGVSTVAWMAVHHATRPPPGAYQHSQFAGAADPWAWLAWSLGHVAVLAIVIPLALVRSSRVRAP